MTAIWGQEVAIPRIRGSEQTVPGTPITNPNEKALHQLLDRLRSSLSQFKVLRAQH